MGKESRENEGKWKMRGEVQSFFDHFFGPRIT